VVGFASVVARVAATGGAVWILVALRANDDAMQVCVGGRRNEFWLQIQMLLRFHVWCNCSWWCSEKMENGSDADPTSADL